MLPTQGHSREALKAVTAIAAVLALLVIAALLVNGCASTPKDRIAYNSIQGATLGVQTALVAYADLLAQGKVPAESRPKVEAAYVIFQRAALLANAIAQKSTATDDEKQAALAGVNAAAAGVYAAARGE